MYWSPIPLIVKVISEDKSNNDKFFEKNNGKNNNFSDF